MFMNVAAAGYLKNKYIFHCLIKKNSKKLKYMEIHCKKTIKSDSIIAQFLDG